MTASLLSFVKGSEKNQRAEFHTLHPDIALTERLEESLLEKDADTSTRRMLRDQDRLKKLPESLRLRWVRLCRMAGEFESAAFLCAMMEKEDKSVFSDVAHFLKMPEEKREVQVARVLPLEPELHNALHQARKMQVDSKRIRHFMARFRGRPDAFARMWMDKLTKKTGYTPVRRPLTDHDMRRHLDGTETLGIYLLDDESRVFCAVLDADLKPDLREKKDGASRRRIYGEARWLLEESVRKAKNLGLCGHPAMSGGKGYHVWFCFEKTLPASEVRRALQPLVLKLNAGQASFKVELFPKQNQLTGKGFGNLVKLPLGVHLKTGSRAWFMGIRERDILSQLSHGAGLAFSRLEGDFLETPDIRSGAISSDPPLPELEKLMAACRPLSQIIKQCLLGCNPGATGEKVLFQTLAFLPEGPELLHKIFSFRPDYNAHRMDWRISMVKGSPLGCRRIHQLLEEESPFCEGMGKDRYTHPLLHMGLTLETVRRPAEGADTLASDLQQLKIVVNRLVERLS
ncbi:hypothetical protein LZ24_02659 [Desulfobotulus alkaliphilus]|uniref:TOTE conflict system primase domain-containing protein n=1 Tax=Desulfobotulus alkaliphilus TaxID=622671 RepID=A0A562RGF9_9BACT|nr:CRISPR-associated primase-polymerase type A1 [Desulfobotulus alkaliphilus]TWI68177.1 hypothetical protein LZ24_02659 [Desulfobotulus alkaliphilus]